MSSDRLRIEGSPPGWVLAGEDVARFGLVNEYLGYLVDRNYSPRTVRSYANGLLALCRWLSVEGIALESVTTDVLLRFLTACRVNGQVDVLAGGHR